MVKLALLGAGRIGQVHARAISMIADAKLKYVFDPMLEAANFIVERSRTTCNAAAIDRKNGSSDASAPCLAKRILNRYTYKTGASVRNSLAEQLKSLFL